MNLADDAELCALMVEAGFNKVFVGIETPSTDPSKNATRCRIARDLVAAVRTLQQRLGHGWIHRRLWTATKATSSNTSSLIINAPGGHRNGGLFLRPHAADAALQTPQTEAGGIGDQR